jgi:O-antigen ligase
LKREDLARLLWRWGWQASFALLALGGSGAGLLLLWIAALLGGKRLHLPLEFRFIMIPLGLWMTITSLFAKAPVVALAASLGSWLMILTAFSVDEDTPSLEELLRLCFYGSIAAALVAYLAPLRGLPRAAGLVGVNAFGTTIFIATALGLTYLNLEPERKVWQWPFLLLMGLAELFTFSRGGWLGFLTVCGVFYLRERRVITAFLILLVLFGALACYWPSLAERGKSIVSIAANQDRIRIYNRTVKMIKQHPILGVGAGNFGSAYKDYCKPDDEIMAHAHSIYLSTMVELGLPGGLLFLLLLGKVLAVAWRIRGCTMGRGILAGLLGCLIHGFFDITIFGIHAGMAFWTLGGFAIYLEAKMAHGKPRFEVGPGLADS